MLGISSRIFILLALLLTAFIGTRLLVRALPGNPIDTLLAESGTTLPREVINRELGLDKPFWPALENDLVRFVHGDFGISLLSKKPITPLLRARFAKTLELTFLTLSMSLALSLSIGLLAAANPLGWMDRLCTIYGGLSAALPIPWIGPMILLLFAVWVPIFPVGGHPFLPALALALNISGVWARLVRERVQESLLRGAAPGARARGIPESKILFKYALAPTAGSLLAFLGTQMGALLAGAFVVEIIFDWRGMGNLLVESVLKRDYPVTEAATFVAAAMSLLGTVLGDWAQNKLDFRFREAEEQ